MDNIIITRDEKKLSRIKDEDINLTVLQREQNEVITSFFLEIIENGFKDCRVREEKSTIPSTIEEWLKDFSEIKGHEEALEELHNTFSLMDTVIGASQYEVVLEHVTDDACRQFHEDHYTLRGICSYIGPKGESIQPGTEGTEYVTNCNVRRDMLGKGNEHIVIDATQIKYMPLFAIGFMKGATYHEDHLSLIHRSREIESLEDHQLEYTDRVVLRVTALD